MEQHKDSMILIASASIFVALGDLRNVITPLGYWLMWGVWLILAASSLLLTKIYKSKYGDSRAIAQQLLLAGYCLLIIGFISSAIYNFDPVTLYQAIKLMIICTIGLLIYKHSARINHESVVAICLITVGVSFVVYLLSKYIFLQYHVVLGDGRQGSLIAYPGVFWKTGAFFSVFALAHFISTKRLAFKSLLLYVIGIYITILDGSRTGFLWITFATGMLIALRFLDQKKNFSLIGLITVSGLLLAGAMYLAIKVSIQSASAPLLALHRQLMADDIREKMLQDSLNHAERCLPFGCGFGTTVTDTTAEPMVIHNAYLATLGDVGVVGLAGFLLVTLGPFIAMLATRPQFAKFTAAPGTYVRYTAALGVAGFAFMMTLHPLSTEMSEWGLLFLMASWIFLRSDSTQPCRSQPT